jgi:hypothetical protein
MTRASSHDGKEAPEDAHDDTQPQPAGSKRRRTGAAPTAAASSRGVANLTPEQLARKRANDREAQRAIRERTKNQIDRLNQRIRELESQQPYHDLQVVLREKDAVQAENADIRKRLESVVAIIQPVLRAAGGLNGECYMRVVGTWNVIRVCIAYSGSYSRALHRNLGPLALSLNLAAGRWD